MRPGDPIATVLVIPIGFDLSTIPICGLGEL